MKSWHMLICLGLIVLGVVLVATGASAVAFLPAIACMLMMGAMMWIMMRGGGSGGSG
jgi:hypothetical protein